MLQVWEATFQVDNSQLCGILPAVILCFDGDIFLVIFSIISLTTTVWIVRPQLLRHCRHCSHTNYASTCAKSFPIAYIHLFRKEQIQYVWLDYQADYRSKTPYKERKLYYHTKISMYEPNNIVIKSLFWMFSTSPIFLLFISSSLYLDVQ